MSKKKYYKYGELIWDIYEKLCEHGKVEVKGKDDARYLSFGRMYYHLVEYPWKVIGITKRLLEELKKNDFERKINGKLIFITRSHLYNRVDFMKEIFEKHKEREELLKYLWEKDITVMSHKEDNKEISDIVDKGECYLFNQKGCEEIFPARQVGFAYNKEKLREFSRIPDKDKVTIKSNKNKKDWKIENLNI